MFQMNILMDQKGLEKVGESGEFGESGDFGEILSRLLTKGGE